MFQTGNNSFGSGGTGYSTAEMHSPSSGGSPDGRWYYSPDDQRRMQEQRPTIANVSDGESPRKGRCSPERQPNEGSLECSLVQSSEGDSSYSGGPLHPQPGAGSPSPKRSSLSDREIANIVEGIDTLVRSMKPRGSSESLADLVVGAMREHFYVRPVQSHCLEIVRDLCKDSATNRSSMATAGVCDDIIHSVKTHTQDALVQEKAFGAIWALGVDSSCRITLLKAGACQQIVSALQCFIAMEDLVRAAISAMRTLGPEAEAREIFKNVDASKVASEAMMVHKGCVSVQRDGCAFLSNCAVNIEKQVVTVVPQEELESVVHAMANHRQELSVMQAACFALRNYTHEEKNCRTLRKCKDIDDLILHAAQFYMRLNLNNPRTALMMPLPFWSEC